MVNVQWCKTNDHLLTSMISVSAGLGLSQ